jgi:opacity protein-like surface antigen
MNNYVMVSEIDVGSFFDADGNVTYRGLKHYVNATYYLAVKQKIGFHIKPNFMVYGLLGLSQNSIGDRIYETAEYFNKKQISYLYGGGLEYYPKQNNKFALFSELFYFTPTNKTLYSGGAKSPSMYALSVHGSVFQVGMRYYFDF